MSFMKTLTPFDAEISEIITELETTEIKDVNIGTASQEELERLYAKNQLKPTIKGEFMEAGFTDVLQEHKIDVELGLSVLTELALRKRCDIRILLGIVRGRCDKDRETELTLQEAADMIYKMAELNFIDYQRIFQRGEQEYHQILVVRYEVTADVQARLDQFQYPLPMITEPETVTHNRSTGYRTLKGSLILKDNHHEDDICLDHLNRMNQIPLSLDADVVSFVQNQWKHLDKPKLGETHEDYQKRVRAFEKYNRSSRDVLEGLMAQGNRFWLTHKYDKRGRTYSQGYHVNYQGNDWNKAVIQFADGELLNAH